MYIAYMEELKRPTVNEDGCRVASDTISGLFFEPSTAELSEDRDPMVGYKSSTSPAAADSASSWR